MADRGEQVKPSEQDPKSIVVPTIELPGESASGGEHEDCETPTLEALAKQMRVQMKRSKSASPEYRKDESHATGESSKQPRRSPSKGFTQKMKELVNSARGKGGNDEERKNLCEEESTEYSTTRLTPPEKDLGIASPSTPSEPMAEKCKSHDYGSSVSSAPSDYSSLAADDLDLASPVFSSAEDKTK